MDKNSVANKPMMQRSIYKRISCIAVRITDRHRKIVCRSSKAMQENRSLHLKLKNSTFKRKTNSFQFETFWQDIYFIASQTRWKRSCPGGNKRGSWNFFEKSINVVGRFLRGGGIFFSKSTTFHAIYIPIYCQSEKGTNFLKQNNFS